MIKRCTVNILGTKYKIEGYKPEEDQMLTDRKLVGFCDSTLKIIKYTIWHDDETYNKYYGGDPTAIKDENEVIRHEILHAFLYESGLGICSCECDAWAKNEEMVDWFAIQSPKIFKAYQDANCL